MLYSSTALMNQVIKPSLEHVDTYSRELTWFIYALIQANCDRNIAKNTFGPFAMSHEAHFELWDEYLVNDPEKASKVRGLASQHRFLKDPDSELTLNIGYAVAIQSQWLCQHCDGDICHLSFEQLIKIWRQQAAPEQHISTDNLCREKRKILTHINQLAS